MRISRAGIWVLLALVAGCSAGPKPEPVADPNSYPANYQKQIAVFLRTTLTDRADFHGALIAEPAIKPVGQSQHYVVCLRFNGHSERKDKVVVFLAGGITQFVDATPEQCGGAAFAPFQALDDVTPPK
jgi:hypothetical protein